MLAVILKSKIKGLLYLKLYVHLFGNAEEKRKAKEGELSSVRIHLGPNILSKQHKVHFWCGFFF